MNSHRLALRIKDQIKKAGKLVGIQQFNSEESFSNIYNESKHKRYDPPVYALGLVYFDPTPELLNEAGMTKDEAMVLVKFSALILMEKRLIRPNGEIVFNQDDLLIIDNQEYDIKRIRKAVHYQQHHIIYVGTVRMG